jgi:EpsI family protein
VRQVRPVQVIVLIVCLVVTGGFVLLKPQGQAYVQNRSLDLSLREFPGWELIENNYLSAVLVNDLKLDDFLFNTYQQGAGQVTLYVGYYGSGKKVGAAHDPQVCYPGQGWLLSHKEKKRLTFPNGEAITYASIVAEQQERKDLIHYWFQVDKHSASNTFKQKVYLFKSKILKAGEANAFVRISTQMNDDEYGQAEERLLDFMQGFYPQLSAHMTQ